MNIHELETRNEALEDAACLLESLALSLITASDDNPRGNMLTAAIVQKCAAIVRQGHIDAECLHHPEMADNFGVCHHPDHKRHAGETSDVEGTG